MIDFAGVRGGNFWRWGLAGKKDALGLAIGATETSNSSYSNRDDIDIGEELV